MFDIGKFSQSQEAKKDPMATVAVELKTANAIQPYSRKYFRELYNNKRCGCDQTRKLRKSFEKFNLVTIGEITACQDDIFYLIHKYTQLYRELLKMGLVFEKPQKSSDPLNWLKPKN